MPGNNNKTQHNPLERAGHTLSAPNKFSALFSHSFLQPDMLWGFFFSVKYSIKGGLK